MGSDSAEEKNFEDYLDEFLNLPFEREMEKFRRLKIREVVSLLGDLNGLHVLDVGIGLQPVSRALNGEPKSLTLVEPILSLLDRDRREFPDSQAVRFGGVVEDFPSAMIPEGGFGLSLLSSVLHEASDPLRMLNSVWSVMEPQAVLIVVVPNRHSIHRVLGVHLGMLDSLTSQTRTETLMQQRHAFSRETLRSMLDECGFQEEASYTHFLKPFTHLQMQSALDAGLISSEDLKVCARLGNVMEEFGSEIISVSRKL